MTTRNRVARAVVRRLLLSVFVVLGAATIGFGALRLAPGDPVRTLLGASNQDPVLVAQVRAQLGLDRSLPEQYVRFLGGLLRGDLGYSYQLDEPVDSLLASQIGATVQLAVAGLVLALVIGTTLAVLTAGRRPAWRRLSSTLELITISSPPFWVGLMLLTFFSFRLHLFPAVGGSGLRGLVLPTIALALGLAGAFAQVLREGLETALEQPFAAASRSRGTSERVVRLRHALRSAMLPLLTLSGWTIGTLLGGSVVIETVFGRPGLGRLMANAIESRDFPVITGVILVSAISFVLVNALVDVLYRVVDPRLREGAA